MMATSESQSEDQMPGALLRSAGILIAILVSLAVILFVAQGALAPPQAYARLCNATDSELSQVRFKGHDFGVLGIGAVTGAVAFDGLFAEESLVVTLKGAIRENILEDHVGDKPLATGTYTYLLAYDEQSRIRAKISPSGECPPRPNNAFQPTPTARLN
jgi:hypothetical protein